MKKFLIFLSILVLLLGGIYIYLRMNGHTIESIMNTPNKIDISVDCSSVQNAVVTSTVTVRVQNLSDRTHDNVTIRIVAYDSKGNVVKEKENTFLRTLQPNSSMMKVVTLPAKAKTCECVVLNSQPR